MVLCDSDVPLCYGNAGSSWSFIICSLSPCLPNQMGRGEEGKGGVVALGGATRQLPVLGACEPGDILKPTTYLGGRCVWGHSGSLSTL